MNLSMHKRMYIILTFGVLYIIYMCMEHILVCIIQYFYQVGKGRVQTLTNVASKNPWLYLSSKLPIIKVQDIKN